MFSGMLLFRFAIAGKAPENICFNQVGLRTKVPKSKTMNTEMP
jgi:hypothetical protein